MEWTEQECVDVLAYRPQQFQRMYPGRRSDDAVWTQRTKLNRIGFVSDLAPTPLVAPRGPSVEVSKPAPAPSLEEIRNASVVAQRLQAAYEESTRQFNLTVNIESDVPVGIVWMSDMHLGSAGVDETRLERDLETIIEAGPKMLRVFIGGDSVDNFIVPSLAHVHRDTATLPPRLQQGYFRGVVERLLPQVVAIGSGNHDAWTQKMAGIDTNLAALAGLPVAYTGEECYIDLRVGFENYVIWRKHRPKGATKLNPTGGVQNHFRWGDRAFDLGVTEHHHTPHMATFDGHGQRRMAITTGSYKTQDEHAREFGHVHGSACAPVTVFFPYRKKILYFDEISDAVHHIAGFW